MTDAPISTKHLARLADSVVRHDERADQVDPASAVCSFGHSQPNLSASRSVMRAEFMSLSRKGRLPTPAPEKWSGRTSACQPVEFLWRRPHAKAMNLPVLTEKV